MYDTEQTIDDMALRELFDIDDDEQPDDPIGTHDGEWRRNADGSWNFWKHEECDDE